MGQKMGINMNGEGGSGLDWAGRGELWVRCAKVVLLMAVTFNLLLLFDFVFLGYVQYFNSDAATKNLLDTREGITKLRGNFQEYKGIRVMPTFHPAYLLRDPSKKRETWEDMKKVRDYLDNP